MGVYSEGKEGESYTILIYVSSNPPTYRRRMLSMGTCSGNEASNQRNGCRIFSQQKTKQEPLAVLV